MTHRTAKLAAVYLLLGLVATWAVAWGSAALSDAQPRFTTLTEAAGPPHRALLIARRPAGRSYILVGVLDEDQMRAERRQPWLPATRFDAPWPRVADPLKAYAPDGTPHPAAVVRTQGWPFAAAYCVLSFAPESWTRRFFAPGSDPWHELVSSRDSAHAIDPPPLAPSGGLAFGRTRHDWLYPVHDTVLPYLPIWPGLLADTLFYALLLAALHQLAAWGRRARRRKRGRCAVCGYDLSGLNSPACPECGHNP